MTTTPGLPTPTRRRPNPAPLEVDWGVSGVRSANGWRGRPLRVTDYTRTQVIDADSRRPRGPPGTTGAARSAGLHTEGAIPDARIVDRREWIQAARGVDAGDDRGRRGVRGKLHTRSPR